MWTHPLLALKGQRMTTATRPASKKSGAGSNRRPLLWIGAGIVAVIALVVGFTLTSSDDETAAVQAGDGSVAISETNEVVVTGEAIPLYQDIETAAAGAVAPTATGIDFGGEPVTLLEPGTPTVIGFFAHWCPHCQREVDELSRYLVETGLPDDVNLMAVSTGVDSSQGNYPPSAWFESEGWPTPILTDDAEGSVARSYGLSGFPFWAIVDADGNLVSRTSGGIGAEQLEAFIELARTSA